MTERLHFHFSLSCIGEGNGNPLQYSCLENLRDGGAWWADLYGVAQSQTRLKRLSSSRVDKNLPANAGDTGSTLTGKIPYATCRASKAHEPQLQKPTYSRAWEPQLLSPCAATTEARPMLYNKRSHHNVKPVHCNEGAPTHSN